MQAQAAVLAALKGGAGAGAFNTGAAAAHLRSPRGVSGVDPEIVSAFRQFDADNSGTIDAKELRHALNLLGLNADLKDAAKIMSKYDADRNEALDVHEFARLVSDLKSHLGKDVAAVAGGTPQRSRSSGAASSSSGPSSGAVDAHVRAAFEHFDADRSGGIDQEELIPALRQLGLSVDGAGASAVLQKYAGARASSLSLAQFASLVTDLERFKGEASPIRKTSLARSSIDPRVRAAFEAADTDGSGDIDTHELAAVLKRLGMEATPAQTAKVLQKYDVNQRDGTLDLFEFDRLVRDLMAYQQGSSVGTSASSSGRGSSSSGVDARVAQIFRECDADGNGVIDSRELREALRRLGMQTSSRDAERVLARYDSENKDGVLDIFEFEKLVKALEAFQQQAGGGAAGGGGGAVGGGADDAKVAMAFRRFDRDGNGALDAAELKEALSFLGVDADSSQVTAVMRRYDADRSGTIELPEFRRLLADILAFQGGGGGGGGDGIPHEVRVAFAHFDRDRSGAIDVRELANALRQLGIDANESQAAAILRQYDSDRSGTIEMDEFARLVKDIRNFQEGSQTAAISAQLERHDVADLFRTHGPTLDELFAAFALMQDELLSSELVPTGDAADAEIRAAFAAFDRDSSGGIDALELTGALAKLGLQASTEQSQRVLARYDADGSRQLELAEFRQLVSDLRSFQGGGATAARAGAIAAAVDGG